MSASQDDPGCEQPAATEPKRFGVRPERRPLPFPEGPPLISLFVTALVSFVVLCLGTLPIFSFLADLLNVGGGLSPLAFPTFFLGSVLLEALFATAVLTIISLTIFLAERHFRFPVWLPYAASFPVAWALTLPSALELGGALSMWLVFGTVVAGVFCLHWQVFTWARTIWD